MQSFVIYYKNLKLRIETRVARRSDNWLLLLHGIQTDKMIFDRWFQHPDLKNYSLLACDLVGFGESSKPLEFSYDLRDQANVVMKLIDTMQIPSAVIIGHSLGGMIATLLLKTMNPKIRGLVSLEGNLTLADCGFSQEFAVMTEHQISSKMNLLADELKKKSKILWLPRIHGLQATPAFVVQRTSVTIMEWAKEGKLATIFGQSSVPRQLVIGADNHFKSRPTSDGLQINIVEKAGHFMLLEQPQATIATIVSFLNKLI